MKKKRVSFTALHSILGFLCLLITACGGGGAAAAGANNTGPVAQTNPVVNNGTGALTTPVTVAVPNQVFSLAIGAEPGALARSDEALRRFVPQVTSFRIALYNEELQLLGEQTVPRGSQATFPGLSQGKYLIRLSGLDAGQTVLGYFDRVASIDGNSTVLIPGLRDGLPPQPFFPQAGVSLPFFIFTAIPDSVTADSEFSVQARAFSAGGEEMTTALNQATLSSTNIALQPPLPSSSTDTQGRVSFNNVRFQAGASGPTEITVAAPGAEPARRSLEVLPPGPFYLSMQRISIGAEEANGRNFDCSLSGQGRFVAFSTLANNLFTGDQNQTTDVMVFDRELNTFEHISKNVNGVQADRFSRYPSISKDGRFVAFLSRATNLIPGVSGVGRAHIFLFDRQDQTMEQVSRPFSPGFPSDSAEPSMSGDGRYVAFASHSSNLTADPISSPQNVFLYDRVSRSMELVSVGTGGGGADGESFDPRVSTDGRFVSFASRADDLIPNDPSSFTSIFVRDRLNNTTERISVNDSGQAADDACFSAVISGDGRFVAYATRATNLVAGGGNAFVDIYLFDRNTRTVTRVSKTPAGNDPASASFEAAISEDGSYVTFKSISTDLVAGLSARGIFVYERASDTIDFVSRGTSGAVNNVLSEEPCISADGSFIGFYSQASNLVDGDTNNEDDVFTVLNPYLRR